MRFLFLVFKETLAKYFSCKLLFIWHFDFQNMFWPQIMILSLQARRQQDPSPGSNLGGGDDLKLR